MFEAVAGAYPERTASCSATGGSPTPTCSSAAGGSAHVLADAGLGARTRAATGSAGHESGQDHIGLYLHNGNEYLEGMLGAYAARVGAVQRQLPLRRRGAALPPARLGSPRRSSTTPRFAPMLAEIRDQAARAGAPPPGRRRARARPLLDGARGLRGGARRGRPRPARRPALPRRPLHPLHRRHHRHAQGRAVAPARHLRRGHGRAALRRRRGPPRPRRRSSRPAPAAGCARLVLPAAHARRGPVELVQHVHRRGQGRAADDPTHLDAGAGLGPRRPRGRAAPSRSSATPSPAR